MPIYEYACTSCGHRFEVRQGFSDAPVEDCTQCGARVRRVLHPAGVIFKGSGWYITDSRKANGSADGASGGVSKSEPQSDSSAKSTTAVADTAAAAANS